MTRDTVFRVPIAIRPRKISGKVIDGVISFICLSSLTALSLALQRKRPRYTWFATDVVAADRARYHSARLCTAAGTENGRGSGGISPHPTSSCSRFANANRARELLFSPVKATTSERASELFRESRARTRTFN